MAAKIVSQEREHVNSIYSNYQENNTLFCTANAASLWVVHLGSVAGSRICIQKE